MSYAHFDLAYFLDFGRAFKFMGLLLTLTILVFAICLTFVIGRELVRCIPAWIRAKSERMNAGLASGPNTWTDILKRKEFLGIADWFITRFSVIGVIGVFVAGGAAWLEQDSFRQGMRVLALSIMFGAASLVGGWLLGLLFGVPRTVARLDDADPAKQAPAAGQVPAPPTSSPAPRSRPVSGVNTNLTDISDWLTKTIVGVGLTQLYQVPTFLWSTAGKLNKHGFAWENYGQLLALALFIYFAVGGFWLGYVATRTVLTELLNQIDGVSRETAQTAVAPSDLNIGYSGVIEPAPPGSLLASADAALLSVTRESLTSPLEIAAWGAAAARAGRMAEARRALELVHSMIPDDPVYRQLLAKVYSAMGDRKASQQLGPDPWLEVFNALYEDPPNGFTTAIKKGEALAAKEKEGAPKSPSLHLWLACAYGQKYADQQKASASDDTLAEIRQKALDECKAAIAIDPNVRPTLQRIWNPPADATDNDLAVFKDDPEFKSLLG